jgi:Zn-dependent protease with chaperone function
MTDSSLWPLALASLENFVLINTVLCILAFFVASAIRASKLARSCQPASLARIYTAALIIPPLISAWLVLGSLLPVAWLGVTQWAKEHEAEHTLHLLNALTVPLDPALAYAALAFALMAATVAIYAAASAYFRIGQVVRQLEIGSEPVTPERVEQVKATCQQYGIDVGLVVSNYPFSFVWGYLRSKLIISTGLLNVLTAEELAGLLEHEAAHYLRRDNLLKWILTACRYISPAFPLNRFLYRWWSAQIEMICDEIAANRTKAPVEVAGALVRLKRLTQALAPRTSQPAQSGFFGEDIESFEHRVTRLLSLKKEAEPSEVSYLSRSWARTAFIILTVFAISLMTVFVTSPLAIHKALEAVLHLN